MTFEVTELFVSESVYESNSTMGILVQNEILLILDVNLWKEVLFEGMESLAKQTMRLF